MSNIASWVIDEDGDIGVMFFGGLVTLINYKNRVIVFWFKRFVRLPRGW